MSRGVVIDPVGGSSVLRVLAGALAPLTSALTLSPVAGPLALLAGLPAPLRSLVLLLRL